MPDVDRPARPAASTSKHRPMRPVDYKPPASVDVILCRPTVRKLYWKSLIAPVGPDTTVDIDLGPTSNCIKDTYVCSHPGEVNNRLVNPNSTLNNSSVAYAACLVAPVDALAVET